MDSLRRCTGALPNLAITRMSLPRLVRAVAIARFHRALVLEPPVAKLVSGCHLDDSDALLARRVGHEHQRGARLGQPSHRHR